MCRLIIAATICLLLPLQLQAERMTPEKLWDLGRIGDAAVSPDGKYVAYLITRYDLAENSGAVDLMLQELPRELTENAEKKVVGFDTPLQTKRAKALLTGVKGLQSLAWLKHESGPKLVYIAPAPEAESGQDTDAAKGSAKQSDPDADESVKQRIEPADPQSRQPTSSPASSQNGTESEQSDESKEQQSAGKPQAWLLDPEGGEPQQLTHVGGGIGNLKVSPAGNAIAFTVDVKLDRTVHEIHPDLPKADARIIDSLLYRHWNAWHDFAYTHVHVLGLDGLQADGDPVDVMKSLKADCPVPPFGGSEQFEFSPDGKELALTLKLVNDPAVSTDTNVYTVSVNGEGMRSITPGMPGYDMVPRYSPDGKYIAFHSMERAGFESDRNRIMLYDRATGAIREITRGLDQTVHDAVWSEDGQRMFFYSETRGTQQLYEIEIASLSVRQISHGRFDFAHIGIIPGTSLILSRQQNMLRPTELALVDTSSSRLATITDVNGEVYATLELPSIEERYFTATDGKQIHNWVILPPDFDRDSDKQWPMLTYCQGGPQGQIGQWFSYRWNFHLMAAKGYVVLAVNRRGLPGFGREWNDQISGDWGGQAMQDILVATDGMMTDPNIDRRRVAAIGASFGGYTVYWLMGNASDRFCAMAAHCGVFNLESMYGSTEELFFVNWDLGGPYWSSAQLAAEYDRFSPHRFVGNWKTPLLIIHGEKDFRVPITQAMEAFTAAQLMGVPSRFLYFPNEGHWVLTPQNGVLWGRVFFEWLDAYCKPDPQ